ncbi:MAG: NUDIX domain-containing protein [Polyangiaceae bacterium]|nr:NUDIX domain-containing protein [Polyangiaceae bacterium]
MVLPSFCPSCGAPVEAVGGSAGRCAGCGRSVFAGSKPAAGVFIERGGRLLLIRRCEDPGRGRWDVPGGFLDEGEDPEEGARREIREELDLDLGRIDLLFVAVNRWGAIAVLDVLYRAVTTEHDPLPGSGAAEHAWFAPDELPEDLAFPWTGRLIERWRAARRGGGSGWGGGSG